jgi:hypothetical protein
MAKLCTMPSVGPVTAATFVATIDNAERFDGPHQAEAYLGLVPSEMSSGEQQELVQGDDAPPERGQGLMGNAAGTEGGRHPLRDDEGRD